jgi:hypothetical protein
MNATVVNNPDMNPSAVTGSLIVVLYAARPVRLKPAEKAGQADRVT